MSQVDLAEAIGRSVQMVGRIERGRSAPSFETLEDIARVLQTPVQDFFASMEVRPVEAHITRITHRLSALNTDELGWIEQLITMALCRPNSAKTPNNPKRKQGGA